MKIEFEDKSYIQCSKNDYGKYIFIIAAKDKSNSQKRIINAVELSADEFKILISDVMPNI